MKVVRWWRVARSSAFGTAASHSNQHVISFLFKHLDHFKSLAPDKIQTVPITTHGCRESQDVGMVSWHSQHLEAENKKPDASLDYWLGRVLGPKWAPWSLWWATPPQQDPRSVTRHLPAADFLTASARLGICHSSSKYFNQNVHLYEFKCDLFWSYRCFSSNKLPHETMKSLYFPHLKEGGHFFPFSNLHLPVAGNDIANQYCSAEGVQMVPPGPPHEKLLIWVERHG